MTAIGRIRFDTGPGSAAGDIIAGSYVPTFPRKVCVRTAVHLVLHQGQLYVNTALIVVDGIALNFYNTKRCHFASPL